MNKFYVFWIIITLEASCGLSPRGKPYKLSNRTETGNIKERPSIPTPEPTPQSSNTHCSSDQGTVSFKDHIEPIFTSYCTGCHNEASMSGGLEYSTLGTPEKWSRAQNAILSKSMPPEGNGLSDCELSTLKRFNDQLAVSPKTITDSCIQDSDEEVTFDAHIKPIFADKCVVCHSSRRPSGGFEFETQNNSTKWSKALKSIVLGKMPPSGPTLTECQLKALTRFAEPGCNLAASLDFDRDVLPIANRYCTECHSSRSLGIDLSKLDDPDDVRSISDRWKTALQSMSNGSMPPSVTKPSVCEVELVKQWVARIKENNDSTKKTFVKSQWQFRLSNFEYRNSIIDIFGSDVAEAVATQISLIPVPVLKNPRFIESIPLPSASDIVAYNLVAEKIGDFYRDKPYRLSEFAPCVDKVNRNDEACLESFTRKMALLLGRRPIEPQSLDTLIQEISDPAETFEGNLINIMVYLLQFSEFLYHVEKGQDYLDSFDKASRLSFAIWSSSPDETLLEYAANGTLETFDGLRFVVNSMLMNDKAKRTFRNYFETVFLRKDIQRLDQPDFFFSGLNRQALLKDMNDEFSSFIDLVVFASRGSLRDLFTSKVALVTSFNLASIYGVPPSPIPQIVPSRGGIFSRSAFLQQEGMYSSPVRRGGRIRTLILCDKVLDNGTRNKGAERPPPDLDTMSNRDFWMAMTGGDSCYGCHIQMNGIGFLLDEFDSVGRHRILEDRYDAEGNIINQFSIITSDLPRITQSDDTEVKDTRAFQDLLTESPKTVSCMNQNIYTYLYQQSLDRGSGPIISKMLDGTSKSATTPIIELFRDLLLRPEFFAKRRTIP